MINRALHSGFLRSANLFPSRPALWVDNAYITYAELKLSALKIAASIQRYAPNSASGLTAVFAYRSEAAFAGVLGALLAGNGYVPLNKTFPSERSRAMLERSGCRSIIIDSASAEQFSEIVEGLQQPSLLIFAEAVAVEQYRQRWPKHTILGLNDLLSESGWTEPVISQNDIAYLLFTSGSTGQPKGVSVQHCNVLAFLDFVVDRYRINEHDRLSQMFDMTFDLSVFDMFTSWQCGACLCCPSQKTLINPGKFIAEQQLTIWFSVPAVAKLMNRMGTLKPGRYPLLRWSLFCGEPMPVETMKAWELAAPESELENLYGPTELTIACMYYRWNSNVARQESELGIVPIGYPFPGMRTKVVNTAMEEVSDGEAGELLMHGPQQTRGYWKDPDKTAETFVAPAGAEEIFYRTGDRVRKPVGDAPMTHLGRIDFQVKIQGYRVELGEVEGLVREVTGLEGVVALGWPLLVGGVEGIETFIEGQIVDKRHLLKRLSTRLPSYMLPKKIHLIDSLPLNLNGKHDRTALLEILENRK